MKSDPKSSSSSSGNSNSSTAGNGGIRVNGNVNNSTSTVSGSNNNGNNKCVTVLSPTTSNTNTNATATASSGSVSITDGSSSSTPSSNQQQTPNNNNKQIQIQILETPIDNEDKDVNCSVNVNKNGSSHLSEKIVCMRDKNKHKNNKNSNNSSGKEHDVDALAMNKTNTNANYEDSDDEQSVPVPGLSPEGGVMHHRIVNVFTNAFAKQNVHFEKAIQSLDTLNEQIIAFVFSPDTDALLKDGKNGEAKYTEAFKVSIALMRRLLLDIQGKFKKMVEENKALAGRLDGDLSQAHKQMAMLRAELSDTNKRISQLSSPPPSTPSTPNHTDSSHTHSYNHHTNSTTTPSTITSTATSNNNNNHHNNNNNNKLGGAEPDSSSNKPSPAAAPAQVNGIQSNNNGLSNHADLEFIDSTSTVDLDSLSSLELRAECDKLLVQNGNLRKEISELRRGSGSGSVSGCATGQDLPQELHHAKEALSALKADRKRLKAEKFELLNQMKQLYATLEDKERELREFIRNYEQKMRESEASLSRLALERDEAERERWNILRHARDEAERGLQLATQLNVREVQVQQMQEELHEAKRQLAQYGIYSELDRGSSSDRTNAGSHATSHYSLVSSLTATYATVGGDRASTDSGVNLRVSSEGDSGFTHQRDSGGGGLQAGSNLSDSANEAVSLDLCGDGSGDGDSMSVISTATLPQLFATPRDSPGPLSYANYNRSMDTSALSRSAEQLLAAEAAEHRRKSGRRDLGRATAGAKGAWGSISRVFARNKHRRTLDPTLYDSQRSSWSPQSSVPASPLAEQESYGDKLRNLEEAATLPMELWRAGMVQAWIEVSLGMPQYGSRCADNIKSGKVLLELSDSELESELGISHPLHRKKLRLAIEEHRNPALVRFPCTVELSHVWVSSEWIVDIGLPQYAENFAACLVDARLLDHLSKKDLEKYLGVTRKFHLASVAHGVHLLRIVAYDRQALAERRRQCENDPLVWTNQHFVQWARSIDLNEYADNLKGSGVHGAFAVLEPSFNGETLASAMGIPPSKQIIRRHLAAELDALLTPARAKITQQYRVTKSRMPSSAPSSAGSGSSGTLTDKQRSDSLGRNVLNNENFRRTNDENHRRTSLRGSLSRALGLKMKQDLLHRRQEEKQHSEEYLGAVGMLGPPPPLPQKRPELSQLSSSINRHTNGSLSSHRQSSNNSSIDQPLLDDFTTSILLQCSTSKLNSHYQTPQPQQQQLLQPRPQSVLGVMSSRQTDAEKEDSNNHHPSDHKTNNSEDLGSRSNTDSMDKSSSGSASALSSNSTDLIKKPTQHRRVKSISSDAEHIAVHTPV